MAFKQPRVPEYRESEGTGKYLRSLVLFLKDFCMDVWTANNQRTGEIDAVKGGLSGIHYPVTSVCGKTGDVTLTAGDVGALAADGTAADSSKLGGKTLAEIMLELYPVGAVYISANSTSPASLFGGTWEQLQDRFLLGAGSTYSAGSTGGEANVTLSKSQVPYKADLYYYYDGNGSVIPSDYCYFKNNVWEYSSGTVKGYTNNFGPTSDANAHDNMPPYLAVYMWKRVS